METTVTINRNNHNKNDYTVRIDIDKVNIKVELTTTKYMLKKTKLPYKLKPGSYTKSYFSHFHSFLSSIDWTRLTSMIVTLVWDSIQKFVQI